jgi:hypothetical protein
VIISSVGVADVAGIDSGRISRFLVAGDEVSRGTMALLVVGVVPGPSIAPLSAFGV